MHLYIGFLGEVYIRVCFGVFCVLVFYPVDLYDFCFHMHIVSHVSDCTCFRIMIHLYRIQTFEPPSHKILFNDGCMSQPNPKSLEILELSIELET